MIQRFERSAGAGPDAAVAGGTSLQLARIIANNTAMTSFPMMLRICRTWWCFQCCMTRFQASRAALGRVLPLCYHRFMATMSLQVNFALAARHFNAGRLAGPTRSAASLLTTQPNNGDTLNLLGLIAGQLGQVQGSIDFLRRAMAANPREPAYPQKPRTPFSWGSAPRQAIAMGRQAVTVNPNSPETHNLLGYILQQAKRSDEALVPVAASLNAAARIPRGPEQLGNA